MNGWIAVLWRPLPPWRWLMWPLGRPTAGMSPWEAIAVAPPLGTPGTSWRSKLLILSNRCCRSPPCATNQPTDRLGFDTSMMDVCLFVQYFKKRKCSFLKDYDFADLRPGRLALSHLWTMFLEPPRFGLHCGFFYFQATDSSRPDHTHVRARAHKRTLNCRGGPLLPGYRKKGAAGRTGSDDAHQALVLVLQGAHTRRRARATCPLVLGAHVLLLQLCLRHLGACWSMRMNLMASAAALVLEVVHPGLHGPSSTRRERERERS